MHFLDLIAGFSRSFGNIFTSKTFGIVFLFIIAIIIVAIITTVIIHSMKQRKENNENQSDNQPENINKEEGYAKDASQKEKCESEKPRQPPRFGKIADYLSLKGFFAVDPLSIAFLNAIKFLERKFGGFGAKYKIPWYLLVGAEDSGKTSIIESMKSESLFSKKTYPFCFFDNGVVIDVGGKQLIDKNAINSENYFWDFLISLLKRYRAKKPVEGVVLTISSDEIYGKNKKTNENISERASFIGRKLRALQNLIGIRIPIYIIITKCDLVPGFQNFCERIPDSFLKQMIGWSSPYGPSEIYSSSWSKKALFNISNNIFQIEREISIEAQEKDSLDELFLLSQEIFSLNSQITNYLDNIFKSDKYDDQMILRGIYFSGSINPVVLPEIDKTTKITTGVPALNLNSNVLSSICFVKDLFLRKIFNEPGIAVPITRRLENAIKNLKIVQILSTTILTIGIIASFRAYSELNTEKTKITSIIGKMESTIKNVESAERSIENNNTEDKKTSSIEKDALFNQYSQEVTDLVCAIENTKLFSFAIPPSWFSPLKHNLKSALRKSYQSTILRAIYVDLLFKSKNLFSYKPNKNDASYNVGLLINPLKSSEFLLLQDFLYNFNDLITNIGYFNLLRKTAKLKYLNELMKYTFGVEIPKEYWNQYEKFSELLEDISFPELEENKYKELAQKTLKRLHNFFLDHILLHKKGSLLYDIQDFFNYLDQPNDRNFFDHQYIRKFANDISKYPLEKPGKTWMDFQYFNPGNAYRNFVNDLSKNKFFGVNFTQEFINKTSVAFKKFQTRLLEFNKMLLVNERVENSTIPSYGIFLLQKSMIHLLEEPYMDYPQEVNIMTTIPIGYVIQWDVNLIQSAVDMGRRLEEFIARYLNFFPPKIQENIEQFARSGLTLNIKSLIGRAQKLIRVQNIGSLGSEEIIRSQINGIKTTTPLFIKLLEILENGSDGDDFITIRSFLWDNCISLLERIDDLLEKFAPFQIQNFSWWDGTSGAALRAYGVRDIDDLKLLIESQKQRIEQLTTEFAQPIIILLSSTVMLGAGKQINPPILRKWERIVDSVNKSKKGSSVASLSILVDFILNKLNEYDIKDVVSKISLKDVEKKSGDFFIETLRKIKLSMLSRAEILKRKISIRAYKELSSYFNRYLKNRFPFLPNNSPFNSPEADPESLRGFFKKFDKYGGTAKKIFDQVYQIGGEVEPSFEFLKNMEDVKNFFAYFLSQGGQEVGEQDLPSFNVKFTFRVNRKRAKNADNIVDWEASVGDGVFITKHDQSETGHWNFGNMVEFKYRWPNTINERPIRDPSQPLMNVVDKTATFKYQGLWSILWLLKLNMAERYEQVVTKNPFSYTLKFLIPLENGKTTVLYNQITLSPPVSQGSKSLKIPVFPIMAPKLPDLSRYENRAILTKNQ